MSLISYRAYKPKSAARRIINLSNEILTEYEQQGFELTLRQLFYQFVARGHIPNNMREYNRLKFIIARAREGGLVDWDRIVDRGRRVNLRAQWRNPERFLRVVCPQFNIDLWQDQLTRVEIWVEKEALVDVVGQAAEPWDVPYFANKGYISASAAWSSAHNRFKRWHDQFSQKIVVIHLGDHDPSGIDMTRDLQDRLSLYSRPYHNEGEGNKVISGLSQTDITVQRIALTMEQVREYNPPPNPAKEADPRWADYTQAFGNESWELDALDPQVIVDLINEAIEEHVDISLFAARQKLEMAGRDQLEEIARDFPEVLEALNLEELDFD